MMRRLLVGAFLALASCGDQTNPQAAQNTFRTVMVAYVGLSIVADAYIVLPSCETGKSPCALDGVKSEIRKAQTVADAAMEQAQIVMNAADTTKYQSALAIAQSALEVYKTALRAYGLK